MDFFFLTLKHPNLDLLLDCFCERIVHALPVELQVVDLDQSSFKDEFILAGSYLDFFFFFFCPFGKASKKI